MKALLQSMIQPEPKQRITAQMAHHHHALDSAFEMDMSTPPFVRTAASLPTEPREKKQVPREQRDRKRSQALQAETGAKFVKVTDNAKADVLQKRQTEAPVIVVPRSNGIVAPATEILATITSEKKTVEETGPESGCVEDMKQNIFQKKGKSSSLMSNINRHLLKILIDLAPQIGHSSNQLEMDNSKHIMFTLLGQAKLTGDANAPSIVRDMTPPAAPVRELRRAASAMALQGDGVPDDIIRCFEVANNKQQQLRDLGRQAGPISRRESQYRRHARVISEGCDRLLNNQLQLAKEEAQERPASRGKD